MVKYLPRRLRSCPQQYRRIVRSGLRPGAVQLRAHILQGLARSSNAGRKIVEYPGLVVPIPATWTSLVVFELSRADLIFAFRVCHVDRYVSPEASILTLIILGYLSGANSNAVGFTVVSFGRCGRGLLAGKERTSTLSTK
jgi:hypothetical protein